LMLGATEIWSAVDADVAAFALASGATDLVAINNLVAYLKAQSLWASSRIYPLKADQNAGSGSTFYGLGGLTSNNGTLVSSPTWGPSGISFNGSSQFGRVSDFTSAASITVFCRANKTDVATGVTCYFGQFDTNNKRSIGMWQTGDEPGDPLAIARSADGGVVQREIYLGDKSGIGSDTCYSAQWLAGAGRSLWANTTNISLTLGLGIPVTTRLDTNADWTLACVLGNNAGLNFGNMTAAAWVFVQSPITDDQRTSITNYINAL